MRRFLIDDSAMYNKELCSKNEDSVVVASMIFIRPMERQGTSSWS
jgi:hypothetical protein